MEPNGKHSGPRPAWTADRLDVRLGQRRLDASQVAGLARALAALHEMPAQGGCADAASLKARAAAASAAIRAHDASLADAAASCEATLRLAEARLAERSRCTARALHGDLRCERIYVDPGGRVLLGEPPRACEAGEPCEDLAPLALALVARGRADLARQLVAGYAEAAGDFALYGVLDAHLALAALVAAEAGLAAAPDNPAARAAAERLLAAPAQLASPDAAARVIAIGGAMASGKTTLAHQLGAAHAATVVSADAARAALARVAGADALAAFEDAAVYDETLRRAGHVLESGRPVVIDACFPTCELRAALVAWAAERGAPLLFIECRADARLTRRRLEERARAQGRPESDWLALRDRLLAAWEPVKELPRAQHLVVDTSRTPEACLDRIQRTLGRSGPHRVRPSLPRGVRIFAS